MPRELMEDLKRNVFCFVAYGSKELRGGEKRGRERLEEGKKRKGR